MEADGIQFKKVKIDDFKNISYLTNDGETARLDGYDAQKIWESLFKQKLIDKQGVITKQWDSAVINDTIELPDKYKDAKYRIIEIVSGRNGEIVSDKKDRVTIKLNKEKLEEKEFINLWDKIKYKSSYKVKFSTQELIENCVKDMKKSLAHIQKPEIKHVRAEVVIRTGIEGITKTNRQHFIEVENNEIPNIVKDLQDSTHLTKKTIIDILTKSNEQDNTFEKLLINPNEYFNRTLKIIKDNLNKLIVDEIEYYKLENQEFSENDFKESFEEWIKNDDYVSRKLVKSNKSIYEYTKCDSIVEVKFAQELENMEDIEFFLKLPNWFKIKTPRGNYNPDWAITVNVDGKSETYFVIETKGTSNIRDLKGFEQDKIACGEKHFELVEDLDYDVCVDYDEFAFKHVHEN